ncbi:dsDNA nuclease domain-containing protein [Leclercia adecarboxylata]|uniref:ABC-three component system protein n=1 Tax=Leclercia adecarboxylata TaxID=83655 RepID=UPI002DB56239|nr:ABC-three component system protein [Leclercia adecarboxylata]MEB6381614.1 dsDNA nuclease domain-containing protein [Leclercia adecarboxylata]
MSDEEASNYPHSAISTWSGFVYQGKVALYHCLKLINQGDNDFQLQLDSTDDFAIYKNNKLVSAHQVKAKIGDYRSNYKDALEKSAAIELDRVAGIKRYFHISQPINDHGDYVDANHERVEFYPYGDFRYCELSKIEELTKDIIKEIYIREAVVFDDGFIDANYCLLSDKISSHALVIHAKIQNDGDTQRKAAYDYRISSETILTDIMDTSPYERKDYYAIELKARLYSHLEERLAESLPGMLDAAYIRARRIYDLIRISEGGDFKTLCQLMKPSEKFSRIQNSDIRRYTDLVHNFNVEPILKRLPHYLDSNNKFYAPTALYLPEPTDKKYCTSEIIAEIKNNDDLGRLLFEFNNLIAARANESFTIDTNYTNCIDMMSIDVQNRIDSNITKSLCISILTKDDAEARLK